jgi:hypothetical protein
VEGERRWAGSLAGKGADDICLMLTLRGGAAAQAAAVTRGWGARLGARPRAPPGLTAQPPFPGVLLSGGLLEGHAGNFGDLMRRLTQAVRAAALALG